MAVFLFFFFLCVKFIEAGKIYFHKRGIYEIYEEDRLDGGSQPK